MSMLSTITPRRRWYCSCPSGLPGLGRIICTTGCILGAPVRQRGGICGDARVQHGKWPITDNRDGRAEFYSKGNWTRPVALSGADAGAIVAAELLQAWGWARRQALGQ